MIFFPIYIKTPSLCERKKIREICKIILIFKILLIIKNILQ